METWLAFMSMWAAMMAAMMLPGLAVSLAAYRRSLSGLSSHRQALALAVAGAAYLAVWTAIGAAVYPFRSLLDDPAPWAGVLALAFAAGLQLSGWKARQLRHCVEAPACAPLPGQDAAGAWRFGIVLGVRCCLCCAGFMAVMLALGMMDLRVMAGVTAAITLERLATFRGAGGGSRASPSSRPRNA